MYRSAVKNTCRTVVRTAVTAVSYTHLRGVRLIAINDGVDSARGDDDFTPFSNIINDYYARDTSR